MGLSNLPSVTRFKKVISLLVVVSFVFSNIAFADIPKQSPQEAKKAAQITTDPEKIVIPHDYGIVKSRYTSKDSRRLVIHIQDAHCNYEAQSNIIKILECLIKNDGLGLISVEGADGFIDTSWFKAFPDADIRKEVADYFMKKGEITGPEFLSITSDYPIKLFGAETRSYYIDNLNAFTSSYPLKEESEKYFNQIKAVLNKLKKDIYSAQLMDLDTKIQDYESKKLSFTDYIKYLETLAVAYKVNLRQYENLFKLVSVLVYEKKINFNVVDKERAAIIDAITKKLNKEQLTELVNRSLEFKVSKISSVEYYDYLRNLALKYGISLANDYPNLFNYIIYNSVYSRIENEKLFSDIKKFEEAVKEKLFANDDQRTLDKLSRNINTLLGLVNIRLLNEDFEYYKAHREEFAHEVFASFINKMVTKFGFAYELDQPSQAVRESMPKLEDFYAIAIKRDKALVDNTIQAMKKENTQVSVLVTGGFHSEGITRILEKQGVSYMVICPNITKDVETPYIKVLTNQRTPLEEILSDTAAKTADAKNVNNGMLAPYLITAARMTGIKEIADRTETDLKAWATMNISPWLPTARADLEKMNIQPTPEILAARFNADVDKAVEKYIAERQLETTASAALRRGAKDVKKMAPPIIAALLAVPQQDHARQDFISSSLKDMIEDAGLTPQALLDAKERAKKIAEYNVRVGGVRAIVENRSEEQVAPKPADIPTGAIAKEAKARFLQSVARGELAWAVFGAGRATRMKLPIMFDKLGIAGLTPSLLSALPASDDMLQDHQITEEILGLIESAKTGVIRNSNDLSIIQRQIIRLRNQLESLVEETPEAGLTIEQVLAGVTFIDVVNGDNFEAMYNQLAAIRFAGFNSERIFFIQQPEEGGQEILPTGETRWQESERWPEGHGDPFIAIAQRAKGTYKIDRNGKLVPTGETLREILIRNGTTKALFAQVNDLHLIEDMANVERWDTALTLMRDNKVEMVMEVVENALKQKGGATFRLGDGSVVMRDTLALKTADLDKYAFPQSLSRMFYILDIPSLGKVNESSIPAYLNERERRSDKKVVVTREFYSGDASSVLSSVTMQQEGVDIYTFKMRSRIGEVFTTTGKQDEEANFKGFVDMLRSDAGAIRMNGGGITAAEHGTRVKGHSAYAQRRLEVLNKENSINGAINRLIRSGDNPSMISGKGIKLPGDIDIPYYLFPETDRKGNELRARLDKLGINFIVIKGLKAELKKAGLAEDLVFHYGVTRSSVYIDEADFNYLFSLSNGVDIILEGATHEKAHIDNEAANLENPEVKLLSEPEIEKIATSYNIRKALMLRDLNDKDVNLKNIAEEELAIKRAFGTNGIRSDDLGEDAQRRIAAGTAETLKSQWQKANPGKELPWLMVGFDPRPQGPKGFNPGEMGEAKAIAETLAAYGFKVLFVPKAVAAPFMISMTGKGVHPRSVYASVMRTASHNEVVDPKSGRLVSGVKLFIDNAPASDAVTGLISERINNKDMARMAASLDFDKGVAEGRIVVIKDGDKDDPDTIEFERLSRSFDLAKLGEAFRSRYPDLNIAINTMNGGMSNFALRVFQTMGFKEGVNFRAFNTTLMNDRSMEAKMTGWIEYTDPATGEHKRVRFAPDPTRAWMRGKDYTDYVASNPENIIALLIDGDADRLVAELNKEIIPNEIGMMAAYYLSKYKGQTGRIVRTVPTTGGLDALSKALGLGEVAVTPVGSKWFAGPNKYYNAKLNDILVAVEESGHIGFIKEDAATHKRELFFDHSIGLATLMLEIMAETGKTWQEFSDEMWAFIKEKTGQEKIAALRYGISKDEGAEKYYDLVARLGNPKEDAFRKEFGTKFEAELAAAGLPWKVTGFDITDAGGAQFIFNGGRKLFPRKSGTDGSVRLYVEVLEAERNKAPDLVKIMRNVMDHFISQKQDFEIISDKLHTPLAAPTPEIAAEFLKGGYNTPKNIQHGYGVPAGAAIDGSFAIGNEGNQGYYVNGGKEIFLSTTASMRDFFERRARILGTPIKYVIKPGIGGQHTPFQGIASTFQVIDAKAGTIIGEYELGKDYEASLVGVIEKLGIKWEEIAVIPSSKSGSTDETMMIFNEIFYVMLKHVSNLSYQNVNGEQFAQLVFDTLHEVNFINGKERAAKDLFKVDSERFKTDSLIELIAMRAADKRIPLTVDMVKNIFGKVLGNMFFETTDRPASSRLSAFIRNSGLDKELGENAPGFGGMFDNVGGRWTADLHMMTFLAYHKLDAEAYWNVRYEGIKQVREGTHQANTLAKKILNENITDIALVVPNELFWFGKAMEQNFNESIWQKGFANLIAVKESAWEAQKANYAGRPASLVINISGTTVPADSFNVVNLNAFDLNVSKQKLANALGDLFTTFYGITHTVGNKLIAMALAEKGYTVNDVDINNLENPATRIFQQNLYLRQPYVELGKGLLEDKLKSLQEKGPQAISAELARIREEAQLGRVISNVEELKLPGSASNMAELALVINEAVKYAQQTGRKFVPFIYLEGDKFLELREHLVSLGIEWVMQGTGDQHISYQQVLAQPQKYLPFIISFVPESMLPGRPAIGFAKGYLHNVSPNMVRDMFAEASYRALTEPRNNEAGEKVTGAAGIFMRIIDKEDNRDMLVQSFERVMAPETKEAAFDHSIESIMQSSVTGERARQVAETLLKVNATPVAKKHLIFVKSAIPAQQLATTTAINYTNFVADYYNEMEGYTADIVDNYEEAVKLLSKNPDWDKTNTIVGLIDRQSLDKMTAELQKNKMEDKTKLLPMEAFDKEQFVPIKGFFDLMSVLVQINRPLDKPEDRELRDAIRDLLNEIGVRDVDGLVGALSVAAYFEDPVKFAKNFIIRLLPPTRASNPAELKERYNAAKKVVESL
ncbi:MAG: hypothetical protein WC404_00025 [Candidatus Omnitrophota bacterium]